MNTTISMWLGIAFLLLAIVATVLQAWLWSFPMVPDPGGPDPNGKSTAPRLGTLAHRISGLLFVLIYIVLMVEMIPRLWEYQVELPARTVVHACMGLVVGILLTAKIAIIRWFQHFGKSLPALGLGILGATVILATLSIPFAVRAHDFGAVMQPENLIRVKSVLAELPWENEVKPDIDGLVTRESLADGQRVLAGKCTDCHDIRTILQRPRSGDGWYDIVLRMAKKPTMGSPIDDDEVATVTSYLVAITPDIQASASLKRKSEVAREENRKEIEVVAEEAKAPVTAAGPNPADVELGKKLMTEKCVDCHELSEVDKHGGDTPEGWAKVLQRMVNDQGLEIDEKDARLIVLHLLVTRPKK